MEKITIVGVDLAKTSFQLHANSAKGKTCLNRKMTRSQMVSFYATLPQYTVAMEACASAHFFGAKFKDFGHEVRLIAPQYVTPFVKSNKNDAADAEAIAEAAVRPNMHFVPIKTARHLDIQAIHRVRERLVKGRTALCNEMRGILGERGVVFNKTIVALIKGVRDLLSTKDEALTPCTNTTPHRHGWKKYSWKNK